MFFVVVIVKRRFDNTIKSVFFSFFSLVTGVPVYVCLCMSMTEGGKEEDSENENKQSARSSVAQFLSKLVSSASYYAYNGYGNNTC